MCKCYDRYVIFIVRIYYFEINLSNDMIVEITKNSDRK